MSVKYYTDCIEPGEGVFYITMGTAKPADRMLGWTKELPQGDGKTTDPCYLDPATFSDKLHDIYIASL